MLENTESIEQEDEQSSITESPINRNGQIHQPMSSNPPLAMSKVLTRFTSCGRCSLFLAAYRIANDREILETALSNSDGDWLPLPWNQELQKLIVKSYGCSLDTDVYYFESCCPECHGKYRYSEPEKDTTAVLLFKI